MAVRHLPAHDGDHVTHEMGFARRVADLVVFMDDGEIIEAVPPDSFFDAPQEERTKLFIGQILSH